MFVDGRISREFPVIFCFIAFTLRLPNAYCDLEPQQPQTNSINSTNSTNSANSEQSNGDLVLLPLRGLRPAHAQLVPCPPELASLADEMSFYCYLLERLEQVPSNSYQITVAAFAAPFDSQLIDCPPRLDVIGRTFNCYLLRRSLDMTSFIVSGIGALFSQIFCEPGFIFQEGKCKSISTL